MNVWISWGQQCDLLNDRLKSKTFAHSAAKLKSCSGDDHAASVSLKSKGSFLCKQTAGRGGTPSLQAATNADLSRTTAPPPQPPLPSHLKKQQTGRQSCACCAELRGLELDSQPTAFISLGDILSKALTLVSLQDKNTHYQFMICIKLSRRLKKKEETLTAFCQTRVEKTLTRQRC